MPKYCDLFITFLKIGTFTIGGGYAMIPLIQREVVTRRGWLTDTEMLDAIALSQTMPGILAANIASIVGQRLRGLRGALVAVLGNILMPILFIILIAALFRQFKDIPAVQHIFMGIRPAVVALIAAPVFTLARKAGVTLRTVWIPILAALLISLFGVSPVLVILIALICGWIYSKLLS
ncbi:MAG: chromate transporter [Bacteroidales bacterium]|nr:chromate transporter [Bacteroidales bacterium]